MNISYRWRRPAFFGALLAFVLVSAVLADPAMPRAARADAADTKLTVKVDGPVGPAWYGSVGTQQGSGIVFHTLWSSLGIGSTATSGTLTGLGYGLHGVAAADPVAPGWTDVGYAAFPSDDADPQCPESPHAYVYGGGVVTLSAQQPDWAVCVRVAPVTEEPGTSIAIKSVSTPWGTGLVDGPSTYDMSWGNIGPYTTLGSGGRPWVPVGAYTFTSDGPPFGTYARMVALDGYSSWDECPVDAAEYVNESVTFEVSLAHPHWMVCVRYFDVPITVSNDPAPPDEWTNSTSDGDDGEWTSSSSDGPAVEPETPYEPPYIPDYPAIEIYPTVPDPAPSADVPASNPEPTPKAVDAPAPTPNNPEPPSVPEPQVTPEPAQAPPADPDEDIVSAGATPLPPSAGDTLGTRGGSSWWFEAGILLVALSTVSVAAGRLPVRRKR